jgi:hypothetical protein
MPDGEWHSRKKIDIDHRRADARMLSDRVWQRFEMPLPRC